MSYITFGVNDIVYIRGVGYGTLLNCGTRNSLSQKIDGVTEKRESVVFDPDLFNSDGDSNHSRRSREEEKEKDKEKKGEKVEKVE